MSRRVPGSPVPAGITLPHPSTAFDGIGIGIIWRGRAKKEGSNQYLANRCGSKPGSHVESRTGVVSPPSLYRRYAASPVLRAASPG